jgi:hypothetical protein
MKRALVLLAFAAVILAGLPAAAQTGTWTAVASTGVVDESAAGLYAFGTTNLGYLAAGPLNPIVARYNVTNTFGGGVSDMPPWTHLELGYLNTAATGSVHADLFQVNPCTGVQTLLCTAVAGVGAGPACTTCSFAPPLNFAAHLYYVQVTISRTAAAATPQAFTLRIF